MSLVGFKAYCKATMSLCGRSVVESILYIILKRQCL